MYTTVFAEAYALLFFSFFLFFFLVLVITCKVRTSSIRYGIRSDKERDVDTRIVFYNNGFWELKDALHKI